MDTLSHQEPAPPRVPIYERRVWKWIVVPAAVVLILVLLGLIFQPGYWRF